MYHLKLCLFLCVAASLAIGSNAHANPTQQLAPILNSDKQIVSANLAADGRQPVVLSQLPNGLRIAILKRSSNETGAAIFMRVKGGFLAETRPSERGLAHLIEHLVFHSPTQKAPNELRRFRQIGMPLTLPEPAGGTTNWRESDYFIVSRTTNPDDLDALLGLFSEVARELTFRSDAVDSQRAEVLREMADKKLGNDIFAGYIAAVAPGSPADVINGQNSDDVRSASIKTIQGLYERLYRPENTTIVIVGDVEPEMIKNIVNAQFGRWQSAKLLLQRAAPQFQTKSIEAVSHSALRHGRHSALLTSVAPLLVPLGSREAQTQSMLTDMVVSRAINSRMAATRPDYPAGKFGFYIEQGDQGHRLLMFWDDFVPAQWKSAVTNLQRTICELQTIGFAEEELDRAKSETIGELKQRVSDMAGVPNHMVAKELADAVTLGRNLISPVELLGMATSTFSEMTPKFINSWWQGQWKSETQHLRVESPDFSGVKNPNRKIRSVAEAEARKQNCRIR